MKPYISFVVVGRNDNYGHRFLYRFQKFVDNLEYLCNKFKLNSELVVVEWNPPKKEKRLYEVLNFKEESILKKRFIEVPEKVHNTIEKHEKFCLFEYLGKNVGVRRAKGDFVLCTNPDIIFSEDVIKFISERKLEPKTLYRVKRFGMSRDIPENLNEGEIIKYCDKNYGECLGIHLDWINPITDTKRFFVKYPRWIVKWFIKIYRILLKGKTYLWKIGGAPGDFSLMSKKDWEELRGHFEISMNGWLDSYLVAEVLTRKKKIKFLKNPLKIFHQTHGYYLAQERNKTNDEQRVLEGNLDKIVQRKMKKNNQSWGLKEVLLKEKVIF